MLGNGMCLGVQGISHCPTDCVVLGFGKLHLGKSALRGVDVDRVERVRRRFPGVIASDDSSSTLATVPITCGRN